jgi:hypothetical protein
MHLQAMVNEIPDLADQLAASIEQMADHGELHALASKLPLREYRTAEFLNRQPVVADRFDVMTVVQRLQVAGELAAAVAVDLDQSMPVTIELQQPGGLAAYEARAAAARIDPPPSSSRSPIVDTHDRLPTACTLRSAKPRR